MVIYSPDVPTVESTRVLEVLQTVFPTYSKSVLTTFNSYD